MQEAGKWPLEISLADSWSGIGLLFVLFLLFFASTVGYGNWIRRRILGPAPAPVELSDSFLIGSALLWAAAFFLAAIQGLHWLPRWFFPLLFLPGLLFAAALLLHLKKIKVKSWTAAALAFAFFILLLRSLGAAIPAQHGDPLLYHLLGPRLWMEAGGFVMHPELPNALLASSWEVLYLWPQLFWFSNKPLYGLVEAQIFSQWLHLWFAWAGCGLLVMRFFTAKKNEKNGAELFLVGFAALFVAGLQWTAPLAKNDLGIAFWVLGALLFLREGIDLGSLRRGFFSGLFAGLAVSGKITAVLSLAPIGFLILLPLFKNKRQRAPFLFLTLSGALLGAAPIYLRNFILSENPFFPLFPTVFPSPWLSGTWGAHFAQVHPGSPLHAFPRIFSRIPELLRESPLIGVSIVASFLVPLIWKKKEARGRILLIAAAFTAYLIFVLTQAPEIEMRYLGAALLLLAGGGVHVLLEGSKRLPPRGKKILFGAILVGLLATSKLPLHILYKIWRSPLGTAYILTHSAGEAKAWVRAQANSRFTVVAGDNETYYLTPTAVAVLTERPDLDAATSEEKNPKRFLTAICEKTRAAFLLDARPAIGVGARFGNTFPAKIIFSAQGANIYELSCGDEAGSSIPQPK